MSGQELMLLILVGVGWTAALYYKSCKLLGSKSKKQ